MLLIVSMCQCPGGSGPARANIGRMSDTGTPETRALVRRIQDVRFTTTRIRVGYDMNGVDELLDRLVDLVEAGQDPRPAAIAAGFETVRWREGYTMEQVDNFLDALLLDPALVPAGSPELPRPSGGSRRAAAPQRATEEMPPPPAPRAARSGSGSGRAATSGSTSRGGRTVGGMLLDHLDAVDKPMPPGETPHLVRSALERLEAETGRPTPDVIAVALEVADVVLAAAAMAEHHGFTVEEAVRERTRLEQQA